MAKYASAQKDRRPDMWEAMADTTRRKILAMLGNRPHTAGEIADQFELSAATVSHHLAVLRGSGLALCERRAQTLIYSLNTVALRALAGEIAALLKK